VRLTDVTVNGTFEKNAFAVYNYGDVDRLSIESLDLSDVVTGWGYVLNFDGITASFDASQFDIALPTGTLLQTALQGDKPPEQPSTDQKIVGTAANDLLRGKQGADILEGGAGNDQLDGGPQADTLRGGPGDDRLYGGDDASTDLLFGGSGTDEAVLPGHAADYQITHQALSADPDGDGSNATVLATRVARSSGGAVTYLYGVERCSFVNDVAAYLASGVGLNDAVAAGPIVDETHGLGYATLQEAVAVAASGSVIRVAGTRDLTSEGVITINQDGVTVQGSAGTTVAGFTLGAGVTTFKLAGDFAADVTGNSGANRIYGNAGANVIDGAGGNDVLVGGGGGDRLMGGAGADLIASLAANDVVLGGADDDRIVIAGSSGGAVTIAGGSGSDTFIVGAIDPLQNIQLGAAIVDFVQGADKLNLGDLHEQGLVPTLPMLALGPPSVTTSVSLAGFGIDGGTGAVTGSVVLYLLDQPVLSASDFVLEDVQETWRAELGGTP
jgi:Ca2+-binding RTX toxin-like protein